MLCVCKYAPSASCTHAYAHELEQLLFFDVLVLAKQVYGHMMWNMTTRSGYEYQLPCICIYMCLAYICIYQGVQWSKMSENGRNLTAPFNTRVNKNVSRKFIIELGCSI
jgi:hypothetical protein